MMRLRINGLNWNVQNVQRDDEKLNDKGGNSCFGVTNYQKLVIYLDGSMPRELYRQVVIHELIHAFTFSFGVHLFANEKTEESVCDFAGAHLDEIYSAANKIMDFCFKRC